MLGYNGVPYHVYSNPFPTKVEIKRIVPFRSPVNSEGHYNSYFCDVCHHEFDGVEEAFEIHIEKEDWESDTIYTEVIVCQECYKKEVGGD